jgi:hypothetical protein
MAFDEKTLRAAADAYRDALEYVGSALAEAGMSNEATALAIGLGVAAGWANGLRQRRQLRRSALDHLAVAVFERREAARGVTTIPVKREPSYYSHYAQELRAVAETAVDENCRHALLRCATDFDRMAQSPNAIRNSVARLYPHH